MGEIGRESGRERRGVSAKNKRKTEEIREENFKGKIDEDREE